MRTTVDVSDELLRAAKGCAARSRQTLGQVVEGALRVLPQRSEAVAARGRATLPTFGGGGLQPGVDDGAAPLELIERVG